MPFLSSKPTINKESGAIKLLLTASLSIAFVLLYPIFILLAPFIFAKKVVDELMLTQGVKKQTNKTVVEFPSFRWGFSEDNIDPWKNTGK